MNDLRPDPLAHLHPVASGAFRKLASYLYGAYEKGDVSAHFRPFEGFRSPVKQQELFNQRPVVTKAPPWQSAHQYGLAVDFVVWTGRAWSWDDKHDWAFLRLAAERHGLKRPLEWDLGHIEHPAWKDVQRALAAHVARGT